MDPERHLVYQLEDRVDWEDLGDADAFAMSAHASICVRLLPRCPTFRTPTVKFYKVRRSSEYDSTLNRVAIQLGAPWWVYLHEMAHAFAWHACGQLDHGPEFRAAYLFLIDLVDPSSAWELRSAFRKSGLRISRSKRFEITDVPASVGKRIDILR